MYRHTVRRAGSTARFAIVLGVGMALHAGWSAADEPAPSPPAAEEPEQDKDLAPLEGRWKVDKMTMSGKATSDRQIDGSTLTFRGNELVWQSGKDENDRERHVLKVEAGSRPKAFFADRVEPARPQSGWMIFEREGDRLRIAFYDAVKGRPKSFEPDEKLIVLELSKAEGSP